MATLLAALANSIAWANVAPTMADRYVATVRDVPVTFELQAEDEDIDPLDPTSEALRFVVLEGPSHGVLIGDLENVVYTPPHLAGVELTYKPSHGYVGTDRIVVSAIDQHGASTAGTTILIDVTSARAEGLLSGNWNAQVTFDVQSGALTVFRTQFTEVYRIDRFSLQGSVDWKLETQSGSQTFVFDALRLQSSVALGDFDVASTLAFDPKAAMIDGHIFDHWTTTTGFTLLGLSFGHSLYLTLPLSSSYQTIRVQGCFAGVSISDTLRVELDDVCGFVLARNDTSFAWSWCDIDLRASLDLTCRGFERATFTAGGIPVSVVSWLPEGISLDVTFSFEPEQKSLSAQLGWVPDRSACLWLMAELETASDSHAGGSIEADRATELRIYGLKLECDVSPGIRFVSATSLHSDDNSKVTGLTDYFEAIRLWGDLGSCCGIPGYWGISMYFYRNASFLFDWGMTVASLDVGASEQFSCSFDLSVHSGDLTQSDPWTEISVGWTARW